MDQSSLSRTEILRQRENLFRSLAKHEGFSEIGLPLCAPAHLFQSVLTGETQLAPGPRFYDGTGEEWALRSDFTAFAMQYVLEHWSSLTLPLKIAYSGKVFQLNKNDTDGQLTGSRHASVRGLKQSFDHGMEALEFGFEILGRGEIEADLEVVALGMEVARSFGHQNLRLVVGDSRISKALFDEVAKMPDVERRVQITLDLEKAFENCDFALFDGVFETAPQLKLLFQASSQNSPALEFGKLLRSKGHNVLFDPYLKRAQSFYSGLTFEMYAADAGGRLRSVGGGGRYDHSFDHFGKSIPAVGLMLKEPNSALELSTPQLEKLTEKPVRVALPKGRLMEKAWEALAAVGLRPAMDPNSTRSLVIPSACGKFEFLLVKNTDVGTYVQTGVASFAFAGSDVLDEDPSDEVRPVTFSFGSCRICLAGHPDQKAILSSGKRVRVATKYGVLTKKLLRRKGISVDVVALQGSVELASVIDMADAIVDLVETGSTLRDNGLVVFEELERTRVHLACSRGFYYEFGEMLEHWRAVWKEKGLAK